MNIDVSSLSIDKALSMAIQSELDTASTYKKLQQTVNNFVLKEKLKFLVFEEEKHYQILVALMQRLYPDKNNQSNMKSFFPKLSLILDEGISVPDLIEVAMEAEKAAEE